MPSKTKKQHTAMQMSQSPEGRARLRQYGVEPVPEKVAKEYTRADKRAGKFQGKKKARKRAKGKGKRHGIS